MWPCEEVAFIVNDETKMVTDYPTCLNGQGAGFVKVPARWTTAVSAASALRLPFGAALWMALFLHAAG